MHAPADKTLFLHFYFFYYNNLFIIYLLYSHSILLYSIYLLFVHYYFKTCMYPDPGKVESVTEKISLSKARCPLFTKLFTLEISGKIEEYLQDMWWQSNNEIHMLIKANRRHKLRNLAMISGLYV